MEGENRGSLAFFSTCRPQLPLPLDIFSCPAPSLSRSDELHLTDGVSNNYNCRPIHPAALKTLIKQPKLAAEGGATEADVDAGRVSGLVFVSERYKCAETLHVALRFNASNKVKVFSLADIFGAADFSAARLEDSGSIAGGYKSGSGTVDHSLIYVSTKEPVREHGSPWTIVYKTNLRTGMTERLTPQGVSDLSPAVSPSGKMVAVASFEGKSWNGETKNLKTDIYVMNVDSEAGQGLGRKLLIANGGWPSWGSDDVLFFHRGIDVDETTPCSMVQTTWAVFRYSISTMETVRVTPDAFQAVTPAAISETKVAVATYGGNARYRHIEVFDMAVPGQAAQISQKIWPKIDHYNPFVLDGGRRIGYHRSRANLQERDDRDDIPRNFNKLKSPMENIELLLLSGMFPVISKDGSNLAFVDNDSKAFKAVWVANSQGLRVVYEMRSVNGNSVFLPMWNQNPKKDTLYVCVGPSFRDSKPLQIYAITNITGPGCARRVQRLTYGSSNNAFPSSSPNGNKFVFRSTCDRSGGERNHKNLYIMEDEEVGEFGERTVTRLTNGPWADTHCQWSPNGEWIVFSSTRNKPEGAADLDIGGFDVRRFDEFLVKPRDPTVVVRLMNSDHGLGRHVHHGYPAFSPDGRSIAVVADLVGVSAEPASLPLFTCTPRSYGDIFVVDIDPDDLSKEGMDVKSFHRITHSRYGCSMPMWTMFRTDDQNPLWQVLVKKKDAYSTPANLYAFPMRCP